MFQSTTPADRVRNNRTNLLFIVLATAAGILCAMYYGRSWFDTAPVTAQVEAQPAQADTMAVGDVLSFDSVMGKVTVTIAGIDGDAVTVTDSDGDKITATMAQLSAAELPFGDVDANARRMMDVIDERVAAGYYVHGK